MTRTIVLGMLAVLAASPATAGTSAPTTLTLVERGEIGCDATSVLFEGLLIPHVEHPYADVRAEAAARIAQYAPFTDGTSPQPAPSPWQSSAIIKREQITDWPGFLAQVKATPRAIRTDERIVYFAYGRSRDTLIDKFTEVSGTAC